MSAGASESARLGADSWALALLVEGWLREALSGPDCDVRRAKELTGMLKDLVTLGQELGGAAPREITVRFVGETEEAGE